MKPLRHLAVRVARVITVTSLVAGCAAVLTRNPVPETLISQAAPYGIPGDLRDWGDTIDKDRVQKLKQALHARVIRSWKAERASGGDGSLEVLALSGGGADGAFGAGLLSGWSARGDRPEFEAVTGISTGAIVSVFAFLGPDYDDELREVYTTYKTDQLFGLSLLGALDALVGGAGVADPQGYRRLIEQYVDDEVIQRIAEEHNKGRTLLIGTTNLDAARPVTWSVSAIAASGHKDAGRLIHDIIQASSAIPGALPPVLIPVVGPDGRTYDEMHVDGGASQQVMFVSPQFPLRNALNALGGNVDRTIYVIINNKLDKPYKPVRPRAISVASAAISSLIGGSGTGDIYKIFAIARRDDIELEVVWIPREFDAEPGEAFDPVYMSKLFELGYRIGKEGGSWQPVPPDFAVID